MRLVVEDGGKRRAFRLGEGVLKVGSAEQASLTLTSAGVAPVHIQLQRVGDQVTVHPVGDADILVGGVPITAPTPAKARAIIAIGDAKLWWEVEETEGQAAPGGVVTHQHKSVVNTKSATRSGRRARQSRKHGLPSWAVVALILLVVAIAFPFLQKAFLATTEFSDASVASRLEAARQLIEVGEYDSAERRLELAEADDGVTAAEEAEIAKIRERLGVERAATARQIANMAGTNAKNQLERYEQSHLEGDPEPAKVRLFLKRTRDFRERFPDHPEISWVERQESRFASLVDLEAEPEWRDVEWEVKVLVAGAPRNYAEAFRLLDEFLERAEGGDAIHATKIRDRYEIDRVQYHSERVELAQREYKAGDVGAAVWWLVHEVIWSGEPKIADQAARILTRMPDALEHFRGYQQKYPDKFDAMLENAIVREAWEKGESGDDAG